MPQSFLKCWRNIWKNFINKNLFPERILLMFLTKSRFVAALTCPTKLFYMADTDYANQSVEDTFLAALAEGGFQVGELAKQYFPEGINIGTLDTIKALAKTNELLKNKNVIIFEAAIKYENCFIRVDVLEKKR